MVEHSRRTLLGGISLALAGCIGLGDDEAEVLDDASEVLQEGFEVLDPDAGIGSMPYTHQLEPLHEELEPILSQLEATEVDDAETSADLETLEATATYQLHLIDAFLALRAHDDHFGDGIDTIHEDISKPDGPVEAFEEAEAAIEPVPGALEAGRDAFDRIDVDRLTEREIEVTVDESELDALDSDTESLIRLTELISSLPVGIGAMVRAGDAYGEESYQEAATLYEEAAETLGPVTDQIFDLNQTIDRHPSQRTTENWTQMAAQLAETADPMANAAAARADGDDERAEAYEEESEIEELPPGYHP